jgi:hypothetical protein
MKNKKCGTTGYCMLCKKLFGYNSGVNDGRLDCEIRKIVKKSKRKNDNSRT